MFNCCLYKHTSKGTEEKIWYIIVIMSRAFLGHKISRYDDYLKYEPRVLYSTISSHIHGGLYRVTLTHL